MNKKQTTLSLLLWSTLLGAEEITLDSLSVTATKFERESKTVPQSVSIVDTKTIEAKNILNVKDTINTIPGVIAEGKSGGYDSRLIIRGAGLKARYGIREIMVMRDGVPMTDPDSFTRMDFIDVDDMESIEVYRGPGSIYAANTSGGVVFITSKSVFDTDNNRFKIGYGSFDTFNANIKASYAIDDSNYAGISISRRQSSNDWREWNTFDTTQASLKFGHIFEDDATLEFEFSYTNANLQLPQSLNKAAFEAYEDSGTTTNDSSAWQKSGRYSDSYFLNLQYEKEFGDVTFKPQAYMTQWSHFHPVTGMINDATDNTVMGLDLAFDYKHELLNTAASFVFGFTGRMDRHDNSEKYQYRDTVTVPTGPTSRIIKVTSDEKGALANSEDGTNTLYGFYLQESFSPSNKLLVDIGLRYDKLNFDIDGNEITRYDYGAGNYVAGSGHYTVTQDYDLYAPKIGLSYALLPTLNAYALVASANQAPTDSEVRANLAYGASPELKASTSINYEVGLKQRSASLSFDMALYYNDVQDELVAVKAPDDSTYYTNAGSTQRLGAELSVDYFITQAFDVGLNGAYYSYTYKEYVDSAGNDYSGNKQRFIPDYQYSLFTGYQYHGFSARLEGVSYGPYYMDDANSEKYDGYTLVTNVMLAYTYEQHKIQLNVNNLFDARYATEVNKVINVGRPDSYYYTPANPLFAMATYSYEF